MNLHDLRYFVALAEEHHFGRAAASCGVSQPTLSTQIHRLENELGVVLAVRVGRRIEITPVGERIAQAARDMLVLSDDIRTMAREEADRMTLQLRVGVFPTLGPFVLPQVIARCDQHEPGVNIHIVEKRTAELLEAIRNGQLDVAAVAAPVKPSCRAVRSRHHFMRTRASWCGSSPTPDPTATSWWLADRPQCTVRRCRP